MSDPLGLLSKSEDPLGLLKEEGTISKTPPWWKTDIIDPGISATALTLGGFGGAALGSPAGGIGAIPGAITGAGLTYGVGERVKKGINVLAGWEQPETLPQALKTAGKEVGEGMIIETIGQGLPLPLNWLINKIPGVATGVKAAFQRISQIANQEGIKLPLPVKTGSAVQSGVYKTAANMPTSEGTIAKEVSESFKQVEQMSQRTIRGKGLEVTPKFAGDVAQTGESLAYQKAHEQGQKLYQSATKLGRANNVQVSLTETNNVGEKILKSDEFDLLPGDLKMSIRNIIEKTTSKTPAQVSPILNVQGQPISTTPPKIEMVKRSLEQVDELRKALSSNAGHESFYKDNAERLFNKLGEALDKDVMRDIKPFKKVEDAWLKARDFQKKEIFGKFKGLTPEKQRAMGEKLLASDPSNILGKMDTVGGLNQVERVLPKPYYDVVRRGKVAEYIKYKTIPIQDGEVRIIDGEALRKTIYEGMAPEYRKKLFKPDELKALDRVIEITRAFNRVEKMGGSQSGTPKGYWYGKLMAGEIGGGYIGGAIGGPIGVGVGMTVSLLGPYGVAKFITSDSGKRFLLEGIKLGEKTKMTGTALGYAGNALTQGYRTTQIEE